MIAIQLKCAESYEMVYNFIFFFFFLGGGGVFKNAYELLTLRALTISMFHKNLSFNVWVKYFEWNFKGILWNSTQNILPIHWKMCNLFISENLRALRFKSSYMVLNIVCIMQNVTKYSYFIDSLRPSYIVKMLGKRLPPVCHQEKLMVTCYQLYLNLNQNTKFSVNNMHSNM